MKPKLSLAIVLTVMSLAVTVTAADYRDAKVDTLVIAYKGAGPMLNDIMGGQIHLIADPMASSLPLAASGKIKALAVTSTKRVAAAPDIPTIAESGLPGFDVTAWFAMFVPAKTPAPIIARMN